MLQCWSATYNLRFTCVTIILKGGLRSKTFNDQRSFSAPSQQELLSVKLLASLMLHFKAASKVQKYWPHAHGYKTQGRRTRYFWEPQ